MSTFNFYRQHDTMDCGPTCIRMVAKYYGRQLRIEALRQQSQISREGVSLLGIAEAAEQAGFNTKGVMLGYEELIKEVKLPTIVHWSQNHFVVVTPGTKKNKVKVADPAKGLITYVSFPNGLTTNYKKQILFTEGLAASAEIITEKKRLSERFFGPLRDLIK